MAQRRMFSMKVIDTDAFCEMPASAQNLYFQIGMRADDDGFYAGVKGLMAKIHASQDDLNVLLARRFLLDRGEGVYVVKHWKMNNYLQSDRYTPTEYQEKKQGLYLKADGSYTTDPNKAEKPCIQNVYTGKVSIGKDSVDKSSEVKSSKEEISSVNNSSLPSLVVNDGSKEENEPNEWNGLNSHQIVDKFVEKSFIRDDEQIRSMYLEVIQRYIDKNGFYDSLKFAIETNDKTVDKKLGSSFYFAHFKSLLETLMGKSMAGGDDDDKPF